MIYILLKDLPFLKKHFCSQKEEVTSYQSFCSAVINSISQNTEDCLCMLFFSHLKRILLKYSLL